MTAAIEAGAANVPAAPITAVSVLAEQITALVVWTQTDAPWRGIVLADLREPMLRGFASGAALVQYAYGAQGSDRDRLVVALARQASRSTEPVWSAALIIACHDWLEAMARWFDEAVEIAEDVASTILVAFLEVACEMRTLPAGRAVRVRWLRLQTRRQVIAWLRGRGALEGGSPDEPRRRRRPPSEQVLRRARVLAGVGAPREVAA